MSQFDQKLNRSANQNALLIVTNWSENWNSLAVCPDLIRNLLLLAFLPDGQVTQTSLGVLLRTMHCQRATLTPSCGCRQRVPSTTRTLGPTPTAPVWNGAWMGGTWRLLPRCWRLGWRTTQRHWYVCMLDSVFVGVHDLVCACCENKQYCTQMYYMTIICVWYCLFYSALPQVIYILFKQCLWHFCTLLWAFRLWISLIMYVCFFLLFVIHVWHPRLLWME